MKLFASDYDGTYWKHTKKGQLDLRKNIKVTKRWQEAGHLFVFATGRPISMMKLEQKMHGIVYDYIVGLNGGIIMSRARFCFSNRWMKQWHERLSREYKKRMFCNMR